jgi:signal transduction histidine kinase
MWFYLNSDIVMQVVSVIVVLMMAVFLFFQLVKGKRMTLLWSYVLCQSSLFIWGLTELTKVWVINQAGQWLVIQIQFFPVCFAGVSWLFICLAAADHDGAAVWRNSRGFLLLSLGLYLVFLINEFHTVFKYNREVFEVGFWVNMAVSYAYIALGISILWRYSVPKYPTAKLKFILLSLAALSPLAANLLFVSKIIRLTYEQMPIPFDITPNAFSLSATLLMIVIVWCRFANISTLAMREIVHSFKAAILVVENDNTIVSYNLAFQRLFLADRAPQKLPEVVELLRPKIMELTNRAQIAAALSVNASLEANAELLIKNEPQNRWFSLNVRPFLSRRGEVVGRTFSLDEITNYKGLLSEVEQKNTELAAMNAKLTAVNGQLAEYAATVEELTLKAERNRIARDSHDTLGNTMALLIKVLEASIISADRNGSETKRQIQEAIRVARDGLGELRRLMLGLAPERLETGSLRAALELLVADFQASGVDIDFTAEGTGDVYSSACKLVIYKICQEALTNAVRHGQAENVTIILKKTAQLIRLIIFDDGRGCPEIHQGFGLSGMEQRVKALHGSIHFYSDGEAGFNIKVEIPVGP